VFAPAVSQGQIGTAEMQPINPNR
jgi:hypothetical protein